MRVPVPVLVVAGSAAVAAVVSLSSPTPQSGGSTAAKIGSPFAANLANILGWVPSGSVGSGLLRGTGYSSVRANIPVAGHANQFATLGTGSLDNGSASGTNGTISGLTVGDSSALSFVDANGGDAASQGGDAGNRASDVANGGGQVGAPQLLMASASSGATASDASTAPAQSAKDLKGFVPQTRDLVTTGTTGNTVTPGTTLSLTNLRNDILRNDMLRNGMGPDNVPITVAVQAVPEPAMLAVLAVGLAGLGVVRRRTIG